jgi:creatinine amidohydrolase
MSSVLAAVLAAAVQAAVPVPGRPAARQEMPGILLEDLTWVEAEKVLTPETIVVLPIGAESKEHGPHLKLKNDFLIAQYLATRVRQKEAVVVAPTVNYSYYPAFVEYPGSTSLRLETSRDMIVDVCRGLSRFGPRRFYALNTGVSTLRALEAAAQALAADGILLRYTDILKALAPVEKRVAFQEGGTHADEIETSMMLYLSPLNVDMSKAVQDYHPGQGGLTRDPKKEGVYSPSGVYGDATLATREKGRTVTEALVAAILAEIEELRKAPVAPVAAPPAVR